MNLKALLLFSTLVRILFRYKKPSPLESSLSSISLTSGLALDKLPLAMYISANTFFASLDSGSSLLHISAASRANLPFRTMPPSCAALWAKPVFFVNLAKSR